MGFQKIAKIDDLWSGEMMAVELNGEQVLVVNINDRIYAYADVCPHQKSRLSEGTLTGRTLRCARHLWEFDVCTGVGVNPQNTCLRGFPVRLDGENIFVDIDAPANASFSERGGAGQ